MQLKDIFLSIPRSTIETLCKYHILPQNVIVWYDLIRFFDSIDLSEEAHQRRITKYCRPFGQMDKYITTADHFHLSDEQVRKVVSKLNQHI